MIKGNQFWKARSSHGRKPKFKDSETLWNGACEYFQWVEDNPLDKALVYQGEVMETPEPLMRAMTISGMCLFLDICEDTWSSYRKRDGFLGVTKKAEQIIYNQKFSGAAAGMLNPNIIARDLGLTDNQSIKHAGKVGLVDLTDSELKKKLEDLENEDE